MAEEGIGAEGALKGQVRNDARQSLEELFKIEQYAEMALHYARLDSISADFTSIVWESLSITSLQRYNPMPVDFFPILPL